MVEVFMRVPLPGQPVRGSKTGKPIMALLDLLGRTWSLGIIWHLQSGIKTFSELQLYCENISPTLLTTRLHELQQTHLIEKHVQGYQLTTIGKDIFTVIAPLGQISQQWQSIFSDKKDTLNE